MKTSKRLNDAEIKKIAEEIADAIRYNDEWDHGMYMESWLFVDLDDGKEACIEFSAGYCNASSYFLGEYITVSNAFVDKGTIYDGNEEWPLHEDDMAKIEEIARRELDGAVVYEFESPYDREVYAF